MHRLDCEEQVTTIKGHVFFMLQIYMCFFAWCRKKKLEKTLFKQGGPFSTKAGIHRGPVSRYILYRHINKTAHFTQFVRTRRCESVNGLNIHHIIWEHIVSLHPTKDKSIFSKIIFNFGKY